MKWTYRVILGINPDEQQVGYKHVIIQPIPGGGLDYAKGEYHSICGTIATSWKRDGGKLTLDVSVPPSTTATIHVPAKDAAA